MLIATRFTYDFGCYGDTVHEGNLQYLSLWFTVGRDYDLYDGEWKMIGGAASSDQFYRVSRSQRHLLIEVPEYSALCAASLTMFCVTGTTA
jgi:glutamine amidotransferase